MLQWAPNTRSPFLMSNSSVQNSNFDDLHLLMNLSDTVRRLEAHTEKSLSSLIGNDDALVNEAMNVYRQQGIDVSEDTVRKALVMHRNKSQEFTPPPAQVLNSKFWNWWLDSPKALPKIRNRVAGGVAIVASMFGAVNLGYTIGAHSWADNIAKMEASATNYQRDWTNNQERLTNLEKNLSPLYKTHPDMLAKIEALRAQLSQPLFTSSKSSKSKDSLVEDFYAMSSGEREEYSKTVAAPLSGMGATLANWERDFQSLVESNTAASLSSVFKLNAPDIFKPVMAAENEKFMLALNSFNPNGMKSAAEVVKNGVSVAQQLASMKSVVSEIADEKARNWVATPFAEAETSLLAGSVARASSLLEDVKNKLSFINNAYTLRIVSRPDEKTGAWRYYDGDQSIRQYYIIVEAVDSQGKTMSMPIFDSEKQEEVVTSKWGVEVPEALFNTLANEKKTTGGIAQPIMGEKVAGKMSESFRYDAQPRRITSW